MAEQPSQDKPRAFQQKRGFRILGLGLQDTIKFFFGGNALIAILALAMICFFLAKEAFYFFPNHLDELRAYRNTGQEYVGHVEAELIAHRKLSSQAVQAYNVQLRSVSGKEYALQEAALELKTLLRDRLENERVLFDKAEEKADLLELIGGEAYELAAAELEAAKSALNSAAFSQVKEIKRSQLENTEELPSKEDFAKLQTAVARATIGEDSPMLDQLEESVETKTAAAAEKYAELGNVVNELADARQPLEELWRFLRKETSENRAEVTKADTAERRKAALESGAELTSTPERKAEMLAQAAAIDLSKPDPDEMTDVVYEAKPEHKRARRELLERTDSLLTRIPISLSDKNANDLIEKMPEIAEDFRKEMARLGEKTSAWSHEKKLTMWHSIITFFLGTEWVTNSSWNDVYGLMPLLTGSTLIALIAIGLAVPFAVAAAIYVNQLARPLEQNIIKPTLEFIQAIPSIVLGFFGIVVLGDALRDFSQIEFLSWIPGFPMQERLNILNAGLLLAFMSIPTIFTLAEDALNNVPKAYRDASLALGSSKLQTVFKVVVPTALSGIVAAVLLGFGRIIGETMVVLLVAGNKIAMPEFSEGLGVLTQPTHTMTGIIAQETGEVEPDSLHWRALFMVGMVLFTISLILNSLSQTVIKRFGNKG